MGFDRFFPKAWEFMNECMSLKWRGCVYSVCMCVLRCALGMCSSVKNAKAKQNHLHRPKRSWIEADCGAFITQLFAFSCSFHASARVLVTFPTTVEEVACHGFLFGIGAWHF